MLKALVVSALALVGLSMISTAQTAPAVPPQAAAAGFTTLSFNEPYQSIYDVAPTKSASAAYYWYPSIWFDSATPTKAQTAVSGHIMQLNWNRTQWAQNKSCDVSVEGENSTAKWGKSYRYGYFEARMKWDNVKGSWPAFWLIPVQGITGAANTGEIDIFEGQGLDNHFYGTLHTWNKSSSMWSSSPNAFTVPKGTDFSQWHTYGLLWVAPANGKPGKVTWYFDNVAVGSANTTSAANSVFDTQNYFLVLTSQEGVDWNNCDPYRDGSPLDINLYINWVHVWAK